MSSTPTRVIAYVDGLNLYNGMHDARGRRGLWLDIESLVTALIGPSRRLLGIHYFTTVMTGPGAVRQLAYLDALRAISTVTEVHEGRLQQKQAVCRACGTSWHTYEEKESDVSLGVRMVEDAAANACDESWLLSADSDMLPAVRSVRRIAAVAGRQVRVVGLFPPHRSSHDLEREVDQVKRIFDRFPERHQLPDPVVGADGVVHHRPAHWR